METNIPIEQAIVQKPKTKISQYKNGSLGVTQNKTAEQEESGSNRLAQLDNGPMMTTSEILDFSSGIDSTEYDYKNDR